MKCEKKQDEEDETNSIQEKTISKQLCYCAKKRAYFAETDPCWQKTTYKIEKVSGHPSEKDHFQSSYRASF